MAHLALSALGRDRPGIVAAVSRVLVDHDVNVEDAQATILGGHFTMMLIVESPEELASERLRAALEEADLGLEALWLTQVDPGAEAPQPTHMVTVYGADHPGIVHAASAALAERGIDITDLNTRLIEEPGEEPLYALMMEVAVPAGGFSGELDDALDEVGAREGVEVSLHELEQDQL